MSPPAGSQSRFGRACSGFSDINYTKMGSSSSKVSCLPWSSKSKSGSSTDFAIRLARDSEDDDEDFAEPIEEYVEIQEPSLSLEAEAEISMLKRAASLLQDIVYIYLEKDFHADISCVQAVNGELQVYGRYTRNLVKFPSELITDPKIKKSILMMLMCSEVARMAYMVADRFLEGKAVASVLRPLLTMLGITQHIEEVDVDLLNPKLRIRSLLEPDRNNELWMCRHRVIKLEGKRGAGKFILDLSGAQFGLYKPLIPFDEYSDNKVACWYFLESREFGHAFDTKRPTYHLKSLKHVVEYGVWSWEENNLLMEYLVRLPGPAFREKKAALLKHVKDLLSVFVDYSDWVANSKACVSGLPIFKPSGRDIELLESLLPYFRNSRHFPGLEMDLVTLKFAHELSDQ